MRAALLLALLLQSLTPASGAPARTLRIRELELATGWFGNDDRARLATNANHVALWKAALGAEVAIEGTLLLQVTPRLVYLSDPTGLLYVRTPAPGQFTPGTRLRLLGTPAAGRFAPSFNARTLETLPGTGDLPEPMILSATNLWTGRYDSRWIQTTGLILRHTQVEWQGQTNPAAVIQAEGAPFIVVLPTGSQPATLCPIGHRVQVQGICRTRDPDADGNPRLLHVLTGTSADITSLGPAPVLTNLAQVKALDPAQAQQATHRAKVRGILTYPSRERTALYLQDGPDATYVRYPGRIVNFNAGHEIEVEGVVRMAAWAPYIDQATVRDLGPAPWPLAASIPVRELATTPAHHARLVTIEGIIRDLVIQRGHLFLSIESDTLFIRTQIPVSPGTKLPPDWMDATIRATGIVFTLEDARRRAAGFNFHPASTNLIEFLRPGTNTLFERPTIPIRTAATLKLNPADRVKVRGVVTLSRPTGQVFLDDGSHGLRAHLFTPLPADPSGAIRPPHPEQVVLHPGDEIELLGAPRFAGSEPGLFAAEYRLLGKGTTPQPRLTDVDELRDPHTESRLVRVSGRLIDHEVRRSGAWFIHTLTLNTRNEVLQAICTTEEELQVPIERNTFAELTGVNASSPRSVGSGGVLRLFLRDAADITPIPPPALWNRPDSLRIAILGGLGLAAAAAVILFQRRQVGRIRASEERLERSEALHRSLNGFATALAPLHTEADILWAVPKHCVSTLGFVDCVIYLVDKPRATLVQKAACGAKNPRAREISNPLEIPIGSGIVGSVAASGRAEIIPNTLADPRYIQDDAVRLSEIAVPILSEGEVIGVIDSEHPAPGFFTGDHLSILTSIASLCANKLVRARIERQLKEMNRGLEELIAERTRELTSTNDRLTREIDDRSRAVKVQKALYQISEAIHTVGDLQSLYARIHEIIGTLMPANNFYIALQDADSGVVSFPYHRDEHDPPPPPRKGTRGMTEYVLRTGRATLADLELIARLKQRQEYTQTGSPARIWLGVPLTAHGRTFGVMAVQDHHNEKVFGEEEKQLLSFVAEQTALAIERKRAEAELHASAERLRQSEERFSKAFRSSPIILSIARMSDGVFIDVNEAFLASLALTREEVIGKTAVELGIWRNTAERSEFVQALLTHGRVTNREISITTLGQRRSLLLSAELIVIGHEQCIVSVSADITERQQAEVELLKSLARERELSQLKNHFVATISHEFRTPLGVILSSADILDRYLHRLSPDQAKDHVRDIRQSALGMASQMENILVFGRGEADRLEFRPQPVHLPDLLRRCITDIAAAMENKCPINLCCDEPFPWVQADESLLRHVATNLLSNAVKYSRPGSTVTCSLYLEDDTLTLKITDSGVGIPDRDRDLLFTPFRRGSNVGRVPGTGMGLAIVKRCVELHGGSVQIDSQEGTGTTVTASWPAPPAEAPNPSSPQELPAVV